MAKLIVQRANLRAFQQKYIVYLNRTRAADIGFAEQIELELEPGRYQLAVGSFFAKEAEVWFDLNDHNKAFEIHSEGIAIIQNLPKYHCLKLVAKGPIQLKKRDHLILLKQAVKGFLWKQWIFNALYLIFLFVLIEQAMTRQGLNVLYLISALLLVNLVIINFSIRKHLLKKISANENL